MTFRKFLRATAAITAGLLSLSACASEQIVEASTRSATGETDSSQPITVEETENGGNEGASTADPDAIMAALGTGAPEQESRTYWSRLASPGALFLSSETIEDLAARATLVVIGQVVSVNDGRSYKSQEQSKVPEAGPLEGFRWVEVEIEVSQELIGEFPVRNDSGTITVDIWREGGAPLLGEELPPPGSSLLLFLVWRGDTIDAEDERQISEAFGPDEAKRYIEDARSRYSIVSPQGLLPWDGAKFSAPLAEPFSPEADTGHGQNDDPLHDGDPIVEQMNRLTIVEWRDSIIKSVKVTG